MLGLWLLLLLLLLMRLIQVVDADADADADVGLEEPPQMLWRLWLLWWLVSFSEGDPEYDSPRGWRMNEPLLLGMVA
jgi:hypothetical protein